MNRPFFLLLIGLLSLQMLVAQTSPGLTLPAKDNDKPVGKTYALIVGISKYNNRDEIGSKFAAENAVDFYRFLFCKSDIKRENLALLIDNDATRESIEDTLITLLSKLKSGDKLLLYFSGFALFRTYTYFGVNQEIPYLTYDESSLPGFLAQNFITVDYINRISTSNVAKGVEVSRVFDLTLTNEKMVGYGSRGYYRRNAGATDNDIWDSIKAAACTFLAKKALVCDSPSRCGTSILFLNPESEPARRENTFSNIFLNAISGGARVNKNGVITNYAIKTYIETKLDSIDPKQKQYVNYFGPFTKDREFNTLIQAPPSFIKSFQQSSQNISEYLNHHLIGEGLNTLSGALQSAIRGYQKQSDLDIISMLLPKSDTADYSTAILDVTVNTPSGVKTFKCNGSVCNPSSSSRGIYSYKIPVILKVGVNKYTINVIDNSGNTQSDSTFLYLKAKKNLAIFFVNDKFDNWPALKNPYRDAIRVAEKLNSDYDYDTLIYYNYDVHDFRLALKNLKRITEGKNDVVFYFSGHGYFEQDTRYGYYVLRDSKEDNTETYVDWNYIEGILCCLENQHVLTLIDVCHGGSFFRDVAMKGDKGLKLEPIDNLNKLKSVQFENDKYKSRICITSGANVSVPDGDQNSPFATDIINKLSDGKMGFDDTELYFAIKDLPTQPVKSTFTGNEAGGKFLFIRK